MASNLNVFLLSALLLAARLALSACAPVEENWAGDPSGEEEEVENAPDKLKDALESVLGITKAHRKEFSDEFRDEVKYDFLDNYKISGLPVNCPYSNFSKDACLRRMLQGLTVYSFLLKHVEKEFPSSSIPSDAAFYCKVLMGEIQKKMRDPEQVTALTSSQEEQLLRDINNADTFHRKMTAHSILYKLHFFLVDGKRVIVNKREKLRQGVVSMDPISFYSQMLRR